MSVHIEASSSVESVYGQKLVTEAKSIRSEDISGSVGKTAWLGAELKYQEVCRA